MARIISQEMILGEQLSFPNPAQAADGLVAVGGDFRPERLLLAYRSGIFPWTDNPISWWSPDPRGIIEFETFHVSRSLEKFMRKQPYRVSFNAAFRAVMVGCAAPSQNRGETWVTDNFIAAYTSLHERGHAHSVECWRGDELVGGIYGVAVGGLFAGESMFHRADNASKIALVALVGRLRANGFSLFDIQMLTDTTRQFGAVEIPRADYLLRLAAAVGRPCRF